MITIPHHCELTIKRANGTIETVDYTAATRAAGRAIIMTIRPKDFVEMQKAYKAAGQELLSYNNVTQEVEDAKPTAAEIASDKAHAEYVAGYNRIAGMAAGGESHDRR